MEISKSYSELLIYNLVSAQYVRNKKDVENKLVKAIGIFEKQLVTKFDDYNSEKDTLELSNCLVDKKNQSILYDIITSEVKGNTEPVIKRELKFTVAGKIKVKKGIRKLLKTQVKVHSRIPEGTEDLITDLNPQELEVFSELIIPKQKIHV